MASTITCVYYNLQTYQHQGLHDVITLTDDDGGAVNLTNATISLYARLTYADTANLFELHVGSGITITNAAAGEFTISASAATLGIDDIEFGHEKDDRVSIPYWCDVTVSGGNLQTVLSGPFTVFRS